MHRASCLLAVSWLAFSGCAGGQGFDSQGGEVTGAGASGAPPPRRGGGAGGGGAGGGIVVPPDAGPVTGSPVLPGTPDNYARVDLPAHFRTPAVLGHDNTPPNNPITDAGATLGRVLFYDTHLSQSGTEACASCHHQSLAFADGRRLGVGFAGGNTRRNAMSIVDARYYRDRRFFWDERAATLEDQVLRPIQDPVEMGLTLPELAARVSAQAYYPALFQGAFGDPSITTDRISRALAQFLRSMVSYRSRYDQGLAGAGDVGAPFATYTAEENRGKGLFLGRGGCAACHLDPGPPGGGGPRPNQALFFIDRPVNNGLDAGVNVADNGVGEITGVAADEGRFKSPSLRNVALTGPYMHDGRFTTLREVIQHYNNGVQAHPNLDPRLRGQGGQPRRLNLSPGDMTDLEAFLGTLTDGAFLADPKFADPFPH